MKTKRINWWYKTYDIRPLEKYKAIWNKIEDLKNIELNAFPVYDDKYIKTKMQTCGDQDYTNFYGSNVLEVGVECGSFTCVFIDSLLVYDKKNNLQITCNFETNEN